MNEPYINRDDPACCQICGTWLNGEIASEKGVHQVCLNQMLYDEWMADKAAEEFRMYGFADLEPVDVNDF